TEFLVFTCLRLLTSALHPCQVISPFAPPPHGTRLSHRFMNGASWAVFWLKHNSNRQFKLMKTAWLTIVCASCTMLSGPMWAQSESQTQSDPSDRNSSASQSQDSSASSDSEKNWTSRHMSATGR